ncbi:MAG: hypothetical protein V1754_04400 [Pseudomonadota bacterium]
MFKNNLFTIAFSALLLVGCEKLLPVSTSTDAAPASPVAKNDGLEKGHPELVKAFKSLMEGCTLAGSGTTYMCKDENVKNQLEQKEKEVGSKTALLTYCHAQEHWNRVVRQLAALRALEVGNFWTMRNEADPEVLECLLNFLSKAHRPVEVTLLGRVTAYVSTVLGKEEYLLNAIGKNTQAKEAVYHHLWTNGRLRVFPLLEKILKENGTPRMKEVVIRGFVYGPPPSDLEHEKICELLLPAISDADLMVAATAAYRSVFSCPEMRTQILQTIATMLKKNRVHDMHVKALAGIADKEPERTKMIGALLTKILANKALEPYVRSESLSTIAKLDPKMGIKLAKKYKNENHEFVRRVVENILR